MNAAVRVVQVPGLSVAQIGVELQRTVLGQDAHGINAGIDTVGQGEVDDTVFSTEGKGWLCGLARQGVKPAALTAGEKHGDTFFFHQFFTSNEIKLVDGTGVSEIQVREEKAAAALGREAGLRPDGRSVSAEEDGPKAQNRPAVGQRTRLFAEAF